VWPWLRSLLRKPGHPFTGEDTPHLCIYPDAGSGACNTELVLNRANRKTNGLSTTNAQKHFTKAHPDSEIAKKRQRGVENRRFL